ncbi:unnamed protein product [Rotaria sordida]|uniref:Uncharacterized protein n=1 Tax=Rotaria sordida TaxID=392033 RepID=A0A814I209_9BILA|nr:unnamed protein product [Rotaria sordida]CAF1634077.1 unnamed protein product [Rotaria sordida]
MVNIQPHIQNLFHGYRIPTNGQGQYKCSHCRELVLFGTSRLNWMIHIKSKRAPEFDKLVGELRLAKKTYQ